MRKCLSLALVAAAVTAMAAKVDIKFEAAAEREVWVLDEVPERMPAAGRAFNTKSISIDVDGASKFIIVHDPKTASVAIKRAGDIQGSWTVTDKDWRAAEITVKAYSSGKPLPSGRIELHTPSFTKSMPVEDGQAKFFGVPFGEVEVKVDYNGGGIPPTAPQVFRIAKDSKPEERTIGVTVVADPASETGPQPKTETQTPPQPQEPWYVKGILWLVGVAIAVAGLIFLMRFLRDRSDVVEEKLKSFGVPVPSDLATDPADDDANAAATVEPFKQAPVVPDGHCPYCGKDQTECICRLDAPRVSTVRHEPELVGPGVELRIPEGEYVVGREGDLVIADATVSRQHARIIREGSTLKVTDLGSANGTYVDGVRIEEETVLKPGATVYFGSVKLRLET